MLQRVVAASAAAFLGRLPPARFRLPSKDAMLCPHSIKCLQAADSAPDPFAISKMLSDAAKLRRFDEGRQSHALLMKKNLPMDLAATNSLMSLYFKCHCVSHAEKVFNEMCERDVYTWTAMVSGYASSGMMEEAMGVFDRIPVRSIITWNAVISACQREGFYEMAFSWFNQMRRIGETPNGTTLVIVLKVCACLSEPMLGRGIHCFMAKSGWLEYALARCSLLDMYAKCGQLLCVEKAFMGSGEHNMVSSSILLAAYVQEGRVVEAEEIFNGMLVKNVITWNVMINGYVRGNMQDRAFSLSVEMMRAGIRPNAFSMTSLLRGCAAPRFSKSGKMFHGFVIKEGFESDTTMCNSMITMYGAHGSIEDARAIFGNMLGAYDVVSWTAMLAAYVSNNDVAKARCVFDEMPRKNLISWNTMMFGYLKNGRSIAESPRIAPDLSSAEEAWMFYHEMEQSEVEPDHFSYNCALSNCACMGGHERTRMIHCKVIKRGFEWETGVGNALITAYGKCGCLHEAKQSFDAMTGRDMISWNALLTGYAQNGRGNEALDFYETMQLSGIAPNRVTFVSLISACSYLGEVEKGKEYFKKMVVCHGFTPTKEHYTCLIDLLGRAGLLHEAEVVARSMPSAERDATLWGALLGAAKMHGDAAVARRAAEEILCLEPLNSAVHVALAETYAATKMWGEVSDIREAMRDRRLIKEPGCSWTEIRNQKHKFLCKDFFHPEAKFIYSQLSCLYANMLVEEDIEEAPPDWVGEPRFSTAASEL